MCKLAIITKTRGKNKKAEDLLKLQLNALKTQPDGCGGITIDFNNKIKTYREFKVEDYDKVYKAILKDLPKSKLVAIHTRIGTSGEKALTNVHFFKPKNYYFAHNGYALKFTESKYSNGFSLPIHNHPGSSSYNNGFSSSMNKGYTYPRKEQLTIENDDPFDIEDTNELAMNFKYIWENQLKIIEKYKNGEDFVHNRKGELITITTAMAALINCTGCSLARRGYCKTHTREVKEILAREFEVEPEDPPFGVIETKKISAPVEKPIVQAKPKSNIHCDSYLFAKNLPNRLTETVIEKAMKEGTFSGMGLLVKNDGKEVYMIVDKPCYAVSDSKSFAGFFSYDPIVEIVDTRGVEICGIKTKTEKVEISMEEETVKLINGVYKMQPNKI